MPCFNAGKPFSGKQADNNNSKTDPAGIEPASLGSKPKRISSTLWIHGFLLIGSVPGKSYVCICILEEHLCLEQIGATVSKLVYSFFYLVDPENKDRGLLSGIRV